MTDDHGGVPRQPSPAPAEPVPVGTRGGGVFLGVMLVVLGAVFLVSQFLPWFDVPVWALWPLIIVVAGVVQVFTPGSNGWGVDRVFEGLGTVIFGLVLLGNTTGHISWSVWWVMVTLWPALVIALGLSILAKGLGQSWLRIVATLVVWLTLAYAVAVSWTGSTLLPPTGWLTTAGGQEFSFSEPGVGVEKADLQLTGGVGEIRIGSGSRLVTVEGSSPFGPPSFSAKQRGDSAQVKVGLPESASGVVVVPGAAGARIDTRLSDSALWDVSLQTGASSLDADLSDVRVRDMELKTGASAVSIRLGDVPDGERESTLVVKSGVSSVRILLPRDADARVVTQTGLVVKDVAGRFERRGGTWETPGFSSADRTWIIKTEAGVGSVSIATY
jgi:hypothetical protein